MHSCLAVIRRITLASAVLSTESILMNRIEIGLVVPPSYALTDVFTLQLMESKLNDLGARKFCT